METKFQRTTSQVQIPIFWAGQFNDTDAKPDLSLSVSSINAPIIKAANQSLVLSSSVGRDMCVCRWISCRCRFECRLSIGKLSRAGAVFRTRDFTNTRFCWDNRRRIRYLHLSDGIRSTVDDSMVARRQPASRLHRTGTQ